MKKLFTLLVVLTVNLAGAFNHGHELSVALLTEQPLGAASPSFIPSVIREVQAAFAVRSGLEITVATHNEFAFGSTQTLVSAIELQGELRHFLLLRSDIGADLVVMMTMPRGAAGHADASESGSVCQGWRAAAVLEADPTDSHSTATRLALAIAHALGARWAAISLALPCPSCKHTLAFPTVSRVCFPFLTPLFLPFSEAKPFFSESSSHC